MIDRTKPYLKNIESKFDEWHKKSPEVRWTISAYALYVRDLATGADGPSGERAEVADLRGPDGSRGHGHSREQQSQAEGCGEDAPAVLAAGTGMTGHRAALRRWSEGRRSSPSPPRGW